MRISRMTPSRPGSRSRLRHASPLRGAVSARLNRLGAQLLDKADAYFKSSVAPAVQAYYTGLGNLRSFSPISARQAPWGQRILSRVQDIRGVFEDARETVSIIGILRGLKVRSAKQAQEAPAPDFGRNKENEMKGVPAGVVKVLDGPQKAMWEEITGALQNIANLDRLILLARTLAFSEGYKLNIGRFWREITQSAKTLGVSTQSLQSENLENLGLFGKVGMAVGELDKAHTIKNRLHEWGEHQAAEGKAQQVIESHVPRLIKAIQTMVRESPLAEFLRKIPEDAKSLAAFKFLMKIPPEQLEDISDPVIMTVLRVIHARRDRKD